MEKTILLGSGIPKHIEVQKRSLINDDTAFIEAIPGIVFAVVISYVYLNIGTYMNGTIGSELVSSYNNNVKTGRINLDIWHNGSLGGTYQVNLTDRNTVEQLDQTISKFYILADGQSVSLNLSINGNTVNTSSHLNDTETLEWTVAALVARGNLSYGNTTITVIWDVNSTYGDVQIKVSGAYYTSTDQRTTLENDSVGTLINISSHYNSNVDIIKIAITISVLLVPIMAIMTMRRYT